MAPAFTILGKRSYEIYLIHILLIQYWKDTPLLIGNSIADWGLKLMAILLLSLAIGCVYHTVEIKTLNALRKIER